MVKVAATRAQLGTLAGLLLISVFVLGVFLDLTVRPPPARSPLQILVNSSPYQYVHGDRQDRGWDFKET